MSLETTLWKLQRPEPEAWWPRPLRLDDRDDREQLAQLVEDGEIVSVHDELDLQLRELAKERHPERTLSAAEHEAAVAALLDGATPENHGAWWFYPWSHALVHLLPRRQFQELRARRNLYKIFPEEATRLRQARVGVVGLSVGRSAAITLAMEGIGGQLRLADPDLLELSNLNRLRASVHELGVNKAVLAAREISSIDPHLDVQLFAQGVTTQNLDAFLIGDGPLDVVVEECDDLALKVLLRERCRELGIPVVMDTSDRGLLDIERFDLEPDRPILHGLVGRVRSTDLVGLPTSEKVPIVMRIVGGEQISGRAAASMAEVEQTITSWPQLASDVAMGGAIAAHACRRIILGQGAPSGRFRIDLDEHLAAPTLATPVALVAPAGAAPTGERAPDLPLGSAHIGADEIRAIVGWGVLAPSGHNVQPWLFHFTRGRLQCLRDPQRGMSQLDFRHGAAHLALGAAVENMVLAAGRMGFRTTVQPFPDEHDPLRVADLEFHFDPGEPPALAEFVERRHTNRREEPRQPLATDALRDLRDATGPGAQLTLLDRPEQLEALAPLVGRGDRLSFLNQQIHAEIMHGIRWRAEDAEATRDGLDIRTMEMSKAEVAAMRLLSRWSKMGVLKRIGGGKVLELGQDAVRQAGAVGLLVVPGTTPRSHFEGGRALERVWLTATRLGLGVHPLATLPYMFARLERGDGEGFSAEERATLESLRDQFRALFPTPADHAEVMLLRFGVAAPPSARSLRRPVDAVLQIG